MAANFAEAARSAAAAKSTVAAKFPAAPFLLRCGMALALICGTCASATCTVIKVHVKRFVA